MDASILLDANFKYAEVEIYLKYWLRFWHLFKNVFFTLGNNIYYVLNVTLVHHHVRSGQIRWNKQTNKGQWAFQ